MNDKTYELKLGDCLSHLRDMPDNSVDSIVTDPPYGLGKEPNPIAMLRDWMTTGHHEVKGKGFMGKEWDAFVPQPQVWAECFRVLKPGGHLVAFAGTRTQDLVALGIRIAGFEIRDMLGWCYGSGFPKSLDISKAIDRAGGIPPHEQSAMLFQKRMAAGLTREQVAKQIGCTPSSVRDWEEGRARSTGAAVEFIIPSERYRKKLADLLGYSVDERQVVGTVSDRRGDGTGYGLGHSGTLRSGGNTVFAHQWQGFGTALKPAIEPITLARKPLDGTVAETVLKWGTGGLNVDGCRVATEGEPLGVGNNNTSLGSASGGIYGKAGGFVFTPSNAGRFPANLVHDGSDEVAAMFPDSKQSRDDSGSAARFFQSCPVDTGDFDPIFYCAKASKKDRNHGCDEPPDQEWRGENTENPNRDRSFHSIKNNHPTVKPNSLMRWLCRLVTPPGGVILDPYMGSGSTGKAAIQEGFRFVGIELLPEHFPIAQARIARTLDDRAGKKS